MLQITIYHENEIVSVYFDYILDFILIEKWQPDIELNHTYKFLDYDFTDVGAIAFRLESTLEN